MTIIAYRNGILAADSRLVVETEAGGARMFPCDKLFRKTIKEGRKKVQVIIATSGEGPAGMVFVDWYGSGLPPPQQLIDGDADFENMILRPEGLFVADKYCRLELVKYRSKAFQFHAIGSGTKAALGAMEMGANAKRAAEVTCNIDPNCGPPIVTMRLRNE